MAVKLIEEGNTVMDHNCPVLGWNENMKNAIR